MRIVFKGSVHRVVSDDSTPRITGFAETVVKLTLAKADVKSKKKTDASGTLALTQNTMKTDARSIFKEDTKDIITRFSKDGKSKSKLSVGSAEKSSSVSGEEATPVQKKTCTDGKLLADSKYTTREKSIKKYNNVKRSKGGGEGDRIYQRFTRTMFREDTTDVEELLGRSVTTQVSPKLIMSPSSRTKPKTSLHLKTNKVDPVDDANISEENRVSEEVTSGITHATGTVQEIELAESSDPVEQQNACRCESRKSSKSASNNSKRYVTLFMSNLRDTYYCEFCRPYKCSESISKSFDIAELKKLRCASCKFSFYERCSDVCSICLKQRKRATPSFK
ncbi:uncharacterized protein LOC105287531 isoform X2 [Ooceraea biroi]|uniref:uncharacterized protein LOC105287531 isoform X2 n=1 Tax=Ooceraea biroi TaxID=2015173 RepID=UPI0005BD7135|nr:uncharacterized protein LOC105287531 isoform X2 [Ooceraea biroi]